MSTIKKITLKREADKYFIQEAYGPNYKFVYFYELEQFVEDKTKEGYMVEIVPNTPTK